MSIKYRIIQLKNHGSIFPKMSLSGFGNGKNLSAFLRLMWQVRRLMFGPSKTCQPTFEGPPLEQVNYREGS
jgi:hypothetical protein